MSRREQVQNYIDDALRDSAAVLSFQVTGEVPTQAEIVASLERMAGVCRVLLPMFASCFDDIAEVIGVPGDFEITR